MSPHRKASISNQPQSAKSEPASSKPAGTQSATKMFLLAVCLAVAGGFSFFVGIGSAFGGAGNWSNHLASICMYAFFGSAAMNLVAVLAGLSLMAETQRFVWWWPLSALAAIGSAWGGWVAIHL